MNARAEAVARLAGRYEARVLEPSPPTVTHGPWFADDPVGRDVPAEPGPDGQRAGYGASPGDALHPEPSLYVVPWSQVPDGPLWQAEHCGGVELSYADLLRADDQREAALSFYRERLTALTGAAAADTGRNSQE